MSHVQNANVTQSSWQTSAAPAILQRMATDVSTLDFEALAREAVEKAQRSRNPIDIELGEYEVVLDAYAVAEMLQNLAFMGLSRHRMCRKSAAL